MRILICHSDSELPARRGLDLWRIVRPFAELAKHVDWDIEEQSYPIDPKLIGSDSRVSTSRLAQEVERLGQYDIIWSSYFPDPVLLDVMLFTQMKFGTKFVLDVDDDVFNIPSHNPIYRSKDGEKNVEALQYGVKESPYLVTSTVPLQLSFNKRRKGPTYLLPNFISGYKHKPFDNKDQVVISFFGSVSHQQDLSVTGALGAIKKLMKKYPQVHFGTVGLEVKGFKERYTYHPGKPGDAWLDEVWPNINADIAIAPIEDTPFNRGKSNIKWQEAAMIPAAFVGSFIPPYAGTVKNNQTGLLVPNGELAWYKALERLVLDKELRDKLANAAWGEVKTEWALEHNWQKLQNIVELIYNEAKEVSSVPNPPQTQSR